MKKLFFTFAIILTAFYSNAGMFWATLSPQVICYGTQPDLKIRLYDFDDYFRYCDGNSDPLKMHDLDIWVDQMDNAHLVYTPPATNNFTMIQGGQMGVTDCDEATITYSTLVTLGYGLNHGHHSIIIRNHYLMGNWPILSLSYWVLSQNEQNTTITATRISPCLTYQFNCHSLQPFLYYTGHDCGGNPQSAQGYETYYSGGVVDYAPMQSVGAEWGCIDAYHDVSYFLWDFGDGSPTEYHPSGYPSNVVVNHTFPGPGQYTVTISNLVPSSCQQTITLTIVGNPINANAGSDVAICSGTSTQLNATGGVGYVWSPTTGLNNPNIYNPVATPTVTTTYTVTVTDAYGCTGSDNVVIAVTSTPTFTITGHNNTCGTICTYTVSNFSSYTNWAWSLDGINFTTFNSNPFTINWGTQTSGTITVRATHIANGISCIGTARFDVYQCCTTSTPYTYNDAIINTSISVPPLQTIVINGTLNITSNAHVTWSWDQVYLGPYAKIIVDPGCWLEIVRGTHLQACRGILWDGIYVSNGHGAVGLVSIDGSTVEDALNAIVSSSGGRYTIMDNSLLTNNFKNIVVHNFNGPFNGPHLGHITNTTINNTRVLLPPWDTRGTYVGIEVDSVNSLFIGDSTTTNRNIFNLPEEGSGGSNFIIGIRAMDSYVKVYNNTFSNIKGNVTYTDPVPKAYYAIYTDALSTSPSAYLAKLTVGNYPVTGYYKDNLFQDCENGIFTVDNKSVNIISNTFTYNTTTANGWGQAIWAGLNSQITSPVEISFNTFNTYRDAVSVDNFISPNIFCNNITLRLPYPTQTTFFSQGILTTNCHTPIISKNIIASQTGGNNDTRVIGIFSNICPGTSMLCNNVSNVGLALTCGGIMNTPATSIVKNIMSNTLIGFTLMSDGANGGRIGQQGSAGNPNDNQWSLIGYAYTYTINSDGTQYPFFVQSGGTYDPLINLTYYGIPITPTHTGGQSTIMCPICKTNGPNGMASLPTQTEISNLYSDIFSANSTLSNEDKWLSKYFLYKEINLHNLPTTGAVSSFMQTAQNTEIGKLIQVNNLIESGNYNQAQNISNSISTNGIMAGSLKEFFDLYSSNLVSGNKYILTSAQKDTLIELAKKCPYTYGPAVFNARTYLKACGETSVYFNTCEYIAPMTSNKKLSYTPKDTIPVLPISVYPNPAQDKLNVIATLPTGSTGEVNIYNEIGKKIITLSLKEGENKLEVNLSNISAGIYYYKIFVDKQIVKSDKLVIIK